MIQRPLWVLFACTFYLTVVFLIVSVFDLTSLDKLSSFLATISLYPTSNTSSSFSSSLFSISYPPSSNFLPQTQPYLTTLATTSPSKTSSRTKTDSSHSVPRWACPRNVANATFTARRMKVNPIISPDTEEMEKNIHNNINGPSMMYVPSWVEHPLGRYYIYFGHHSGSFIRLAYADDLAGPWKALPGGCIRAEETPGPMWHIASPDVLVDEETQTIRLYFHGMRRNRADGLQSERLEKWGQVTLLAISKDGLHFDILPKPLSPPYLRVFRYGGYHYGLVKDLEDGGLILRSPDGFEPFEVGPHIIQRMRHAAVLLCGDVLYIFFTRLWDTPERVLWAKILLNQGEGESPWLQWKLDGTVGELLRPQESWEGALLPMTEGSPGGAYEELHALRDPAIFLDPVTNATFLLYSASGEKKIGIALLSPF